MSYATEVIQRSTRVPLLLLLSLAAHLAHLQAQAPEIGLRVGGAVYSGDLYPGEIRLENSLPAAAFFYRHRLHQSLALRADLLVGALKGSDEAPLDILAEKRNRSFHTLFGEISFSVEYYFFAPPSPYARIKPEPYVFVGLGGMFFSGHEENPSSDFNQFQPTVPFGAGLKLSLSQSIGIGIQASLHKTFFDYLDNVSASTFKEKDYAYGDLHSTDWYYSLGISLSYAIYSLKCPFPIEKEDRTY